MNKGFVLSFEAILALILFTFLFINLTINQTNEDSFKEIIAIKKANDLLRVWSYSPDILQIKSDTDFVFKNNATVIIDELEIVKSKLNGESIATSTEIIDEFLIKRDVRIIIYFN